MNKKSKATLVIFSTICVFFIVYEVCNKLKDLELENNKMKKNIETIQLQLRKQSKLAAINTILIKAIAVNKGFLPKKNKNKFVNLED